MYICMKIVHTFFSSDVLATKELTLCGSDVCLRMLRAYVYMCVCVNVYVCIDVALCGSDVCVSMHCVCVYMYMDIYAYLCGYVYMLYVYMYVCEQHIDGLAALHIYIYIYTHTHADTHLYLLHLVIESVQHINGLAAHIHVYIYIHTHI
jgi:hypothetical protein